MQRKALLRYGSVATTSRARPGTSAWFAWASIAALALVVGCSADHGDGPGGVPGGGNGGDGGSAGSAGAGSGGTGGPGGAGGAGGVGGSAGSAGNPPPVIEPTNTPFKEDRTGDSGVDQGTLDDLRNGGNQALDILYPYDGTVFPVGLPAPIIQWQGATDAAYVHVKYANQDTVDYHYANQVSDPGRIQIPRADWNEIVARSQQSPLVVTVSAMQGGTVETAVTRWKIALGKLDGALYYNTYNAPEVSGGAVMRLFLGHEQSEPFLFHEGLSNPATGPCVSCHSVSFDGSTMQASFHDYIPFAKQFRAGIYDLEAGGAANPAPRIENIPAGTFGALTPDGSEMLSMGNPGCTGGAESYPRHPNNMHLVEGPAEAALWDTETGQKIDAKGLNPDWYMWMPQFSPNGDKVVFNHARPMDNGRTNRRTLAVMDYDDATHTFSNLRVIYEDDAPSPSQQYNGYTTPALGGAIPCDANHCDGSDANRTCQGQPGSVTSMGPFNDTCSEPCYPGWPFFTPDGKYVIFVRGNEPDFASAAPGGREFAAQSSLYAVDVETGEVHPLDAANGRNPDGSSYLPNPDQLNVEYFPTVMPVATGGYYWVFWTSRRDYGHLHLGGGAGVERPEAKRIWVSAIDITSQGGELPTSVGDLSHPPFYLPGQSQSGNVRAFVALKPCQQNGNSCETGLDCCSGFCDIEEGAESGMCVAEPDRCSKIKERCETADDCCEPENPDDPPLSCIGGRCDFIVIE